MFKMKYFLRYQRMKLSKLPEDQTAFNVHGLKYLILQKWQSYWSYFTNSVQSQSKFKWYSLKPYEKIQNFIWRHKRIFKSKLNKNDAAEGAHPISNYTTES